MWLTKVVQSILRVQWVHIGAIIVNSDASGPFLGSLKGLAIAIDIDASGSFVGSLKGLEFPV